MLLAQPLFAPPAAAAPAQASAASAAVSSATLPAVTKITFSNGLKLLVLENHTSPTVSLNIFFRAGGIDNISGQTGLAHLFEHMAFKGTDVIGTTDYKAEKKLMEQMDAVALKINDETAKTAPDAATVAALKKQLAELLEKADKYVVKNEYSKLYSEMGGSRLNAYTSADLTAYTVSLPANQVENWMIMESSRFKNPVLREFYKERDVVLEELRMGKSRPQTVLYGAMLNAAFSASPYRTMVIGHEDDVARLIRPQAEAYYRTYYGPNNATLVIVGDVNTKQTVAMAKKYFGGLASRPMPAVTLTKEPARNGEHRAAVKFAASPEIFIAYNTPNPQHEDAPALAVISDLLSSGRTSRLYKNIVEGKQLALYAGSSASSPGIREDGIFLIYSAPKAPNTTDMIEKAVYEEIEKFKSEPVSAGDLSKVINQYEAALISRMEHNAGMGNQIGYAECVFGDWSFDWSFLTRIKKVTPDDIRRVAAKYFTRDNRSAAWIETIESAASPETAK